jgi:hypothetical protein
LYSLFSIRLISDFPFTHLPQCGENETHTLEFNCQFGLSLPPFSQQSAVYVGQYQFDDKQIPYYLHQLDNGWRIHFADLLDFYISPEQIICYSSSNLHDHIIENLFLGIVIAFLLEQRRIPVLHAAGVSVDNQAVAFLAHSRQGKSTLAASFVEAGFPLFSDDMLPIEQRHVAYWGRPGYPQMRQWPKEALFFRGAYDDLRPIYPGSEKRYVPVGTGGYGLFHNSPLPLTCLYLLSRQNEGSDIHIEPLSQRNALLELVRHSYIGRLVQVAGLQPQRLNTFIDLITKVPIRRFVYPSGYEHLSCIRDAILEDLARS